MLDLRVREGQVVYMLEHRLPAIAKRRHGRQKRSQELLLAHLQQSERTHVTYLIVTHWHSRVSGLVTAVSPGGVRYSVHHTDVMRA